MNFQILTRNCVATVGIVVTEFDRLRMYSRGHDLLPKMLVECRNGMKYRYVGLVGGSIKPSLGKAVEMRGGTVDGCQNYATVTTVVFRQ